MGTFAANNINSWFGAFDFTGHLNNTALTIEQEPLDSTVFGTAAVPTVGRKRQAGLEDVSSSCNGFADEATSGPDSFLWTAQGAAATPLTHSVDGAESSVAYFYPAKTFAFTKFGEIGALTPFTFTAQGSRSNGAYGAIRGRVAKAKGDVSATGAIGTGQQLGAVGATQYLYAAFHVFTAGTTITVVLESDDNSGFTSATTRATIGPLTAVGGTMVARVAGAITDTYFRFRVTAITGTFTVAGAIGIK